MAENNQLSPMKKINSLCKNSNLDPLSLNDENSSTYFKNIQLTLNKESTKHQLNLVKHNKKLNLYSMFKNDCHKTTCLNTITNITHKKNTKLIDTWKSSSTHWNGQTYHPQNPRKSPNFFLLPFKWNRKWITFYAILSSLLTRLSAWTQSPT